MRLSSLEITYTILTFLVVILVTSLNIFFLKKILKTKKQNKKNFWILIILISISQLLIILATACKVLSFVLVVGSYQLEVILATWSTFSGLCLTILTLMLLDYHLKKAKS